MTDTNTLTSYGIYALTVLKEAGSETLAVGIKQPYRDKTQYRRLLESEFARYQEFDHQNILKYHALKEPDGLGLCIMMEWESARPLADYVAENHTDEEKKAIVSQIAEALGYIHSRCCVHAALTPGAIFVTTKGDCVKVLNFRQRFADGLKQPADSLRFIAPEAKDGTVTLDARADIFSLGQIMRYLNMPLSYRPVTDGCCSFGRSERFADVDAFLAALNNQRHTRTDSRYAADTPAAPATIGSRRLLGGLAMAVVVLAVVAAFWIFGNRATEEAADSPAPTEQQADQPSATENATTSAPAASQQSFLDELMPQVRTDLDGIYTKAKSKKSAARRVTRYYKGLRKVLVDRGLNQTQLDAFDQAFGEYNQQKKTE